MENSDNSKCYQITPLGYDRLENLSPLCKWVLEEMIRNGGSMTEEQMSTNYVKYYPLHSPPLKAN